MAIHREQLVVAVLILLLQLTHKATAAGGLDHLKLLVQKIVNSTHPDCGGENSAGHVYLSLTNEYTFTLIKLQRAALSLQSQRRCVEGQWLLLCLDSSCMNLCSFYGVPN